MIELNLTLGGEAVPTAIHTAIVAGWAGRDKAAVERHIVELEELGVPRPSATPLFYRVSAARVTTDAEIESTAAASGEVEAVLLRSGGRLVSIASPPPEKRDDVETHYVFVRPSGVDLRDVAELVDAGHVTPHVEATYPLEEAADAHERIEGGHVRGKLVLSVP